jgi:hypothetical protein
MKRYFIFFSLLLACGYASTAQLHYRIERADSCRYRLSVIKKNGTNDSILDYKIFPYKISRLFQADINNDGIVDALVLAEKQTVFDKVTRKRINIWTTNGRNIHPLWLGSFLPHPLYDFNVMKQGNENHVITVEYDAGGLFLVAEYRWHSFGLQFIRYLLKGGTLHETTMLVSPP